MNFWWREVRRKFTSSALHHAADLFLQLQPFLLQALDLDDRLKVNKSHHKPPPRRNPVTFDAGNV